MDADDLQVDEELDSHDEFLIGPFNSGNASGKDANEVECSYDDLENDVREDDGGLDDEADGDELEAEQQKEDGQDGDDGEKSCEEDDGSGSDSSTDADEGM